MSPLRVWHIWVGSAAAVCLAFGLLMIGWGRGVCLSTYMSTRVLANGSTAHVPLCLRYSTSWGVIGLGLLVVTGASLGLTAAWLSRSRPRLATLLAAFGGVLALPMGLLSQSLFLFLFPGSLILLAVLRVLHPGPKPRPADPTVAEELGVSDEDVLRWRARAEADAAARPVEDAPTGAEDGSEARRPTLEETVAPPEDSAAQVRNGASPSMNGAHADGDARAEGPEGGPPSGDGEQERRRADTPSA